MKRHLITRSFRWSCKWQGGDLYLYCHFMAGKDCNVCSLRIDRHELDFKGEFVNYVSSHIKRMTDSMIKTAIKNASKDYYAYPLASNSPN